MLINAASPFSYMTFILISNFIPEWYNYVVFLLTIPIFGCLAISLFFLVESPIYLLLESLDLDQYEKVVE